MNKAMHLAKTKIRRTKILRTKMIMYRTEGNCQHKKNRWLMRPKTCFINNLLNNKKCCKKKNKDKMIWKRRLKKTLRSEVQRTTLQMKPRLKTGYFKEYWKSWRQSLGLQSSKAKISSNSNMKSQKISNQDNSSNSSNSSNKKKGITILKETTMSSSSSNRKILTRKQMLYRRKPQPVPRMPMTSNSNKNKKRSTVSMVRLETSRTKLARNLTGTFYKH
mmetsp:Transcript_36668/g.71952  ORF Transcript_36668/g.71952 Transcript_36668/m.71952 type:complete len:219 (+) Transcript_36668:508-1164(+)